ncbi:helix-turn-helix domain-containing protein [Streptomyces sp. NPDC059943]|uniref:helix-turn-helix domain-containing protein n=1 Tax=Streptomyces sp. NPDC059943 TaxID=3347010 RepID=UPI00364A470D
MSATLVVLGGDVEEQAFNRAVAGLIRDARKRAGVTQAYLGHQAGLSRGSIANIEAGTQAPPLYRLALIAVALNIQPAELLPPLRPDEAAGLPARHAADVAAVWAQAAKVRDSRGEG